LVRFNHDGDFFLTCAKDGEVNLVRTENCERVGTYNPAGDKPGAVYAVDVTMDCTYVVTANADGKIIFFTFTGEVVKTVNHGGIVKYVEWNQRPGKQNKVVTCNDKFKSGNELSVPHRIMVWKFENNQCQRALCIDEQLPMKATKVKWGPYDETLISIHEEGTVCVFDSTSGERLELITAHDKPVTSLNFSADRMLMITSSKDQSAKLWSMDNYECIKTYRTDRPLNDAAISPLFQAEEEPKYHVLLGGGQDAKDVTTTGSSSGKFEALLWHMVFEEELGQVKGGFGPLNTIAWFPDGRGYVTGGEDGYVRVHHFDQDYFTSKKFE